MYKTTSEPVYPKFDSGLVKNVASESRAKIAAEALAARAVCFETPLVPALCLLALSSARFFSRFITRVDLAGLSAPRGAPGGRGGRGI